jgi:HlyD family secretion protein
MPIMPPAPGVDRVPAPLSPPVPVPSDRPLPPASQPRVPAAPLTAASRRPSAALQRRAIVVGVVLLIVAGAVFALRPKPVDIETARATVGTMRVTVDADALTRVRTHFTVAAPVTGLVQRIALREGDRVSAGQAVAVIATPPAHPTERRAAEARLDAADAGRLQASARLAEASATLAQAERDAVRARRLAEAGAVPDRDVETAAVVVASHRADLSAARAQLRVAAAELAQARTALDAAAGAGGTTTVRAPGAGRVLRIPERSARVVAAGAPLLEIGDPASLEVAADVLSSDAAAIQPGQEVLFRGWGGAPLRGVVRLVEPSARTRVSALGVEEQRLTVVIDLVAAPPALGDGYRLDASAIVWEGRGVLVIPASALLRAGERWELYRVRNGRASRQAVRIGHVGGGQAQVLDGLRAGDSVIVFPPDALRDGQRVRAEP